MVVDKKVLFEKNYLEHMINKMFLDKYSSNRCINISDRITKINIKLIVDIFKDKDTTSDPVTTAEVIISLPTAALLDSTKMEALDFRAGLRDIENPETKIKLRALYACYECSQLIKYQKIPETSYLFRYKDSGHINFDDMNKVVVGRI